jgi:hypothetical protein
MTVAIQPVYDRAGYFSDDGYAVVFNRDGSISSIINKQGNLCLRAKTGVIYHVRDDLYSYFSEVTNESLLVRLKDNRIISRKTQVFGPAAGDGYLLATFDY